MIDSAQSARYTNFHLHSQNNTLTNTYDSGISVCMRTTLNIDDSLLKQAGEYTGEKEKTALVRMGLEALIQREAARRLAAIGGTMPKLEIPPRRRTKPE